MRVVTVAAAAWAYVSVIALRETLTALLPARVLSFVSPLVQGALIVVLGSALLLIPPTSTRVAQRGFTEWRAASPPMWFLGVYEVMAGDILLEAPRTRLSPRQARGDAAARQRLQPAPARVRRTGATGGDSPRAWRCCSRPSPTCGMPGGSLRRHQRRGAAGDGAPADCGLAG